MSELYAWANPLKGVSMFDHTWVTDYTPNESTIPSGKNYWYCWGIFHASAGHGKIGEANADATIAKSLVEPNVAPPQFPGQSGEPQDGSITFYGVDGVCHNVANQILYSTGNATTEPIRVEKANGYHLSTFFYTNYGLNMSGWSSLVAQYAPNVKSPNDDFSEWLLKSIGSKITSKEIMEVLGVRTAAQLALQKLHSSVPNMTPTEVKIAIGAILLTALADVEKIIGLQNFLILFPSLTKVPLTADEASNWIDTEMLEHSVSYIHSKKQ